MCFRRITVSLQLYVLLPYYSISTIFTPISVSSILLHCKVFTNSCVYFPERVILIVRFSDSCSRGCAWLLAAERLSLSSLTTSAQVKVASLTGCCRLLSRSAWRPSVKALCYTVLFFPHTVFSLFTAHFTTLFCSSTDCL